MTELNEEQGSAPAGGLSDEAMAAQLSCPNGEQGLAIAEAMNRANGLVSERSIELLEAQSGQNIVEIGPGNGMLSRDLVKLLGANGHYQALERADDMIPQLQRNLAVGAPGRVSIHHLDCIYAPIAPGSVDAIFGVNFIYFIADLGALFARFDQWLKPGGRVVLGTRSAEAMGALPFTQHGFILRSREEVIDLLAAAGWEVSEPEYFEEQAQQVEGRTLKVDALIFIARKAA